MDPTLLCHTIIAVAEMVTELCRGQSAKQKEEIWQWFLDDWKPARAFLASLTPKS